MLSTGGVVICCGVDLGSGCEPGYGLLPVDREVGLPHLPIPLHLPICLTLRQPLPQDLHHSNLLALAHMMTPEDLEDEERTPQD